MTDLADGQDNRKLARSLLIAVAVLGFVAREVIAWVSIGSGDVHILQYIAGSIRHEGLLGLYRRDPNITNTPLTAYWCLLCDVAARLTHLPFPFVLKQLMIASDAIVCIVLFKIWLHRGAGRTQAVAVATAYAWCPLAILMSAYHGNFDPVLAMLALAAVYFIDRRNAWFIGGLLLGMAINVKLIPLLLIPMLVAVCPDLRRLLHFAAGLAVMSVQYVLLYPWTSDTYLHNMIHYQSIIDKWGVMMFLYEASRQPRFSAVTQTLMYEYFDRGRWVLLLLVALAAVRARRVRLSACESAACGAAIFMIVAPGFAIQYLIFPAPLLFATRRAPAIVYGITAGLMALFYYWLNWTGGMPFDSTGISTTPRAPGPQFGVLAWATLVAFVWTTLQLKLHHNATGLLPLPRRPARS